MAGPYLWGTASRLSPEARQCTGIDFVEQNRCLGGSGKQKKFGWGKHRKARCQSRSVWVIGTMGRAPGVITKLFGETAIFFFFLGRRGLVDPQRITTVKPRNHRAPTSRWFASTTHAASRPAPREEKLFRFVCAAQEAEWGLVLSDYDKGGYTDEFCRSRAQCRAPIERIPVFVGGEDRRNAALVP